MEPLSIISLLINLATLNPNHTMSTNHNQQEYHSIYQVKQDIFNESFKNNNIQDIKNFSNLNILLNN
tara:strand:- start:616 stop:816 length:201 start_codon:yes stop_codon:yes gene_type:complete